MESQIALREKLDQILPPLPQDRVAYSLSNRQLEPFRSAAKRPRLQVEWTRIKPGGYVLSTLTPIIFKAGTMIDEVQVKAIRSRTQTWHNFVIELGVSRLEQPDIERLREDIERKWFGMPAKFKELGWTSDPRSQSIDYLPESDESDEVDPKDEDNGGDADESVV